MLTYVYTYILAYLTVGIAAFSLQKRCPYDSASNKPASPRSEIRGNAPMSSATHNYQQNCMEHKHLNHKARKITQNAADGKSDNFEGIWPHV